MAVTRKLSFLQEVLMAADTKRVSSRGTTELDPSEPRDSKTQPNQLALG